MPPQTPALVHMQRVGCAQFAIHQDFTGRARVNCLALCKGMGLLKGSSFESSFQVRCRCRWTSTLN